MAIFDPNLSIDGDLGQATKKRSGDPARAQRMQQQMQQPVTGPRGVVGGITVDMPKPSAVPAVAPPQSSGAGSGKPGILDGLAGGAKAVVGGAALPLAMGIDAARTGITSAVGGDPNTLPGGPSRYADAASATLDQGLAQARGAADSLQTGAREALGAQPAKQLSIAGDLPVAPAEARQPLATAVARQAPAVPESQAAPEYSRTGIGDGLPGGEIAMRRGADGVYEFTNETGAVRGAGAAPVGGAGGIGDGIGTFSQAAPGSAQLAIDRFERANQERAKMIASSRRGQIGEGGGRVTIVRDSSRGPTLAELQNARLEAGLARTESLRSQTQEGILAGLDSRQNSAVQREQALQGIASGAMELQNAQQLQQLRDQLADPSLSAEQRETARDTYTSLSTPAKDRFKSQDVILGRDENGRDIRGTQLIDVTTGRPVAGIGDNIPSRRAVTRAEVEQAAKEDGVSVDAYIQSLKDMGVVVS